MVNVADLRLAVKSVPFPHPLMVAAGIVKTAEQVRERLETDDIPEWGSITTQGGSGNGGRDYHPTYRTAKNGERFLFCTQNSLGLPNPGMKYVEQHAPELIRRYHNADKPLAVNVSGEGPDDLAELIERAVACGFPIITANGACPNKVDAQNRPLPILCWDQESVERLFENVERRIGMISKILIWKISVGMPRNLLEFNRKRVADSRSFDGIFPGNTFPNTLDYDEDWSATIKTANGINRGGMAGPAIQPMALDNVEYCANRMPASKIVVGAGGIENAIDARKFFQAGATLVQYNSGYRESGEDPAFTTRILVDLVEGAD